MKREFTPFLLVTNEHNSRILMIPSSISTVHNGHNRDLLEIVFFIPFSLFCSAVQSQTLGSAVVFVSILIVLWCVGSLLAGKMIINHNAKKL